MTTSAPKTIAWNVDTQYDFMRPDGKLAVKDAHLIEPALERLTWSLRTAGIPIVHTADWHTEASAELSANPDYKTTYPPHCMADSTGAAHVKASRPENPLVLDWRNVGSLLMRMTDGRLMLDAVVDSAQQSGKNEYLLYKDKFDVFSGTPLAGPLLERLEPDRVIVYGVATNVCVDQAVRGLIARGKEVLVVDDAIKELPAEQAAIPLERILADWKRLGVKHTTTAFVHENLEYGTGKGIHTEQHYIGRGDE